ncbi:hypothetical protein SDC9_178508 [bioreactor metagenome]|uniref:Uncharacterized protein n=1 Tax=bioreactor metagenome TaxID=1076179 RepID=A0A645GWH3_9ZZZZ
MKGVANDSRFIELINIPEIIHPNDPNKRMRENSFEGSSRLSKEMELHNDIVGIKQMLYNSSTGKNKEKCWICVSQSNNSAPTIFKNANTLLGEKNRSAIIPTITGDIIAAMAAVLYASPICTPEK